MDTVMQSPTEIAEELDRQITMMLASVDRLRAARDVLVPKKKRTGRPPGSPTRKKTTRIPIPEREAQILVLLGETPGMKTTDIADKLGMTRGHARNILRRMAGSGQVKEKPGEGSTTPSSWTRGRTRQRRATA